ncbi:MAG: alpha/beta hydrolase-fold protein, partial [Bacteroidota bacterium]
MKKLLYLFVMLCFLWPMQEGQGQTALETEHLIDSKAFGTQRRIRIFIPERYFRDSNVIYTVTYMLDCQDNEVWNAAKGTIGYLVSRYRIMPMILVGIDSPDRGMEFRPEREELRSHFREEVIPWVETQYRVNSFRTVIGHSWGGSFVGSTLFGPHSDLFNAYIGISPSLGAMGGFIHDQADSLLRLGQPLPKFFYCTAGGQGQNEIESLDEMARMDSVIQANPVKDLVWRQEFFPSLDHWSCVLPSLNNSLVALSQQHFTDLPIIMAVVQEKEAELAYRMKTYLSRQELIYGYAHWPTPYYLNKIGEDLREQGYLEGGLSLVRWSLQNEPNYLRASINVVDIYRRMGKSAEAKEAAQRALYPKRNG